MIQVTKFWCIISHHNTSYQTGFSSQSFQLVRSFILSLLWADA